MTVPEYVYKECRKAGFTKEGCCALLGNMQHESAFVPNNVEDGRGWGDEAYTSAVDNGTYANFAGDGIGYGIAQWTYGTRKQKYLAYFKSKGKSIGDLNTQVEFLIKEMKEDFSSIYMQLRSGTNLYNLTWVLLDIWENPAEKQQNMVRRYQSAQEWYAKVAQLEALPDTGSTSGTSSASASAGSMTQNEAISKVLDLARSEIGYHEKATNSQLDDKTANSGSGNWTKFARDLDALGNFYNGAKNGYAWCDCFVDWLFYKAFGATVGMNMICQPQRSAGAGCLYSAQYYRNAGRWATNPQPGDQIFFSYAAGEVSHTGIVESVTNGQIVTIEGNTSEQVARRNYASSDARIYGYGRPKWELATGGSAQTESSSAEATSMRILKKGSTGDDVKEMQEKLIKLGYDLGSWGADGDFGNDTDTAVRKFQLDQRLVPVDGEFGPDTSAALEKAIAALDKQGATTQTEAPAQTGEKKEFKFGDVVNFTGSRHYVMPNMDIGSSCKPGEAKITSVSKGSRHPYHLVRTAKSTSNVYGWVNAEDVS